MNTDVNDNDEEDDIHPFDENDIVEVLEENETTDIPHSEDEEERDNIEIPERDDAKLTFTEHTKGVLSCAFHPKTNKIVATGGMDDNAFVWDAANGNIIFKCEGHEDSVEIVSFSYDGSYLATADLNGVIKVWRTRDYILVNTLELEDELGWLEWHSCTNVLVASSQIGMVYMYRIPSGVSKMVIASYGQDCLSGKLLYDGRSVACGYKDGTVKIVDLKQGTVLQDIRSNDERGGVTCLDVHKNSSLIICGCTSGAVILINSNSGRVVSVLQGIQNTDEGSYIEAVSFSKDSSCQLAISGSLDGTLIIWDICKQTLRHKYNFSSCINHVAWHPSLPLVFSCHFEGLVRTFDAKAGLVVKEFMGHQKSCLNMSLSSDGSLLMTTSEDKTVRIFAIENY